jgi:putative serine protease PepD
MSDDSPAQRPEADRQDRRDENDQTGVIGVNQTQPIERPDTPAQERSWFSEFGGEHPTEGPGVPARADAAWGSDRADALAEEAHRARYSDPGLTSGQPTDSPTGAPTSALTGSPAPAPAHAPQYVPSAPYAYPDESARPVVEGPSPISPTSPADPTNPAGGVPLTSVPPPPKRRRGLLVLTVVALCLLAGVFGGFVGQLLGDRVQAGRSALPEPGPGVTARPAGSVANIAAQVLPSVVTIKVDAGSEGAGTGSGFVIDNKGHILTNNHVVSAGADGAAIQVVLSNGETEDATIVGRDVSYDLAVIRLERTDLPPLQLGSSGDVIVGDEVIAVGAPLGLEQTVTSGIVSAMNRPVTPGFGDETSFINAIQTDAAINPGNSGGPLLNLKGQVIGVNSAIARVPGTGSATGGNIGLGFAIPSDQARRTADQLITTGKATHPIIGVLLNRTYSGEGAQVEDDTKAVTPNGPAAKAGVQPGDIVVGFEGKAIRTPDQLIVSIRARAVGDTVSLTIKRDGKELELKMTLEAQPDN